MRGLIKDKDGRFYIARTYYIGALESLVKLAIWQHLYYANERGGGLPDVEDLMEDGTNEEFTDVKAACAYAVKEKLDGGVVEMVYVVRTDDELRLVKEYNDEDELVCAVCANSTEQRAKCTYRTYDPTHRVFEMFQEESRAINKTLNEWYGKEEVYLLIPVFFDCDESFACNYNEPNRYGPGLLGESMGIVQSSASWFTTEAFEHVRITD